MSQLLSQMFPVISVLVKMQSWNRNPWRYMLEVNVGNCYRGVNYLPERVKKQALSYDRGRKAANWTQLLLCERNATRGVRKCHCALQEQKPTRKIIKQKGRLFLQPRSHLWCPCRQNLRRSQHGSQGSAPSWQGQVCLGLKDGNLVTVVSHFHSMIVGPSFSPLPSHALHCHPVHLFWVWLAPSERSLPIPFATCAGLCLHVLWSSSSILNSSISSLGTPRSLCYRQSLLSQKSLAHLIVSQLLVMRIIPMPCCVCSPAVLTALHSQVKCFHVA